MADDSSYPRLMRRLACQNTLFEVFFDTVQTPGGRIVEDFLIVRPKIMAPGDIVGVCVLPERDGRIGLMRGYRHQLQDHVWQAPAGFIDPGETAEQTAIRELIEETSLTCQEGKLCRLGIHYPDAGLIEGRVALFVARDCFIGADSAVIEAEIGAGELEYFDRAALTELIDTTQSIGASTLIACLRYLRLP